MPKADGTHILFTYTHNFLLTFFTFREKMKIIREALDAGYDWVRERRKGRGPIS